MGIILHIRKTAYITKNNRPIDMNFQTILQTNELQ